MSAADARDPPPPPATGAGAAAGADLVAPATARRLKDIPVLQDQVQVFLDKNRAIESKVPMDAIWDDLVRLRDLNEIFVTAVHGGLLTLDQALRFALYMKTDVEPMMEQEVEDAAKHLRPFRADAALVYVSQYYDEGVKTLAGPEEDSSDDEDEDQLSDVEEDSGDD